MLSESASIVSYLHPLWAAATRAQYPPSRSTFCTALRLAVGHSFAAEYTRRFKQDFQPLDVICKCRNKERTILHIILDRPLLQSVCSAAQIDNNPSTPPSMSYSVPQAGPSSCSDSWNAPAAHKPSKAHGSPALPRSTPTRTCAIGTTLGLQARKHSKQR